MSELILIAIVLIAGVNWLYSRFCEKDREARPQVFRSKRQLTTGRAFSGRV